MESATQVSVDRLTSFMSGLSIEDNNEYFITDVGNKVILFLNANGIQNLSLVSRNIHLVVLKSAYYVWYGCNKPKLCTVMSKSILSLDETHGNRFKETAGFIGALIQSGATDIVRKTARECKSYYSRFEKLINTAAQYQIQQGDIGEAKKTLIQAKNLARQVSVERARELYLIEIIAMQAQCDDIENAVMTLEDLKEDDSQLEALLHIVQSQVQYGHVDGVIETMRKVMMRIDLLQHEHEYKKDRALREIDRLLIKMSDIPNANETAQRLSEEYNRNEILSILQIKWLLQNGKINEAQESLISKKEEILYGSGTIKEEYLGYILATQSEIDNDSAKDTLQQIKEIVLGLEVSNGGVKKLIMIVEGQMQYGDIEGAKSTLKDIVAMAKQVQLELYDFNEILRYLLELDDVKTAKEFLSCIPSTYEREPVPGYNESNALNDIAKAQFKKGNKEEAISTLKDAKNGALLIFEPYFKTKALIRTARTMFQCGDIEEAKNILKEAGNNVGSVPTDYYKARFLINIAELQLQMGVVCVEKDAFSNAKKVALSILEDHSPIRKGHHKDKALSALFIACFRAGDEKNMTEAFDSIRYLDKKVTALLQAIHIVEKQIESKTLTTLIPFIESLQKLRMTVDATG